MDILLKKISIVSMLTLFYAGHINCKQIFIRNLNGKTTQIELNDIASRDELYQIIALQNGLSDATRLRLTLAGREIDKDLSLLGTETTLTAIGLKSPNYRRLNTFLNEIANEQNAENKSIKLGAKTSSFLPEELNNEQRALIDLALEKEAEGDIDNYNNILISLLKERLSEFDLE